MRIIALLALALLACSTRHSSAVASTKQPNVILIVVDDLGWTDLSCMGSEFYETPNIDRLADQGMRFTSAYSACTVCSPSRAAILTGKYPARLHITDWIEGHKRPRAKLLVPDWTMFLPHEEITIAEMLKEEGYATCHIGKWHLGGEAYHPKTHGFDHNIGGYHRGQPPSYFAPYKIPTLDEGPDGEYLTDREAEEAVRFITENRENPFFLYLPHYTVHTPIQSKEDKHAKYADKVRPGMKQTRADYAAMIESLDESTGRIMATLEEFEIADRTLIIFTSDNGGLVLGRPPITDNSPLRSGKGSEYEGGVRVPLIIRWPETITPGTTSDEPVMGIDFLPTIHEASNVSARLPKTIDGQSLIPLLRGEGGIRSRRTLLALPTLSPRRRDALQCDPRGQPPPHPLLRAQPRGIIRSGEGHRGDNQPGFRHAVENSAPRRSTRSMAKCAERPASQTQSKLERRMSRKLGQRFSAIQ